MKQEKDGSELFYDTYALYAIATGKESYLKFSKGHRIATTLMNLYELYYTLNRDGQNELAEEFFDRLVSSCVKMGADIIKESAKFRAKNVKSKFSYVDCLGYIIAKNKNVKFLTGDDAFNGMPNVEFVK